MKKIPLEPGLLQVFRTFIGVRLLLVLITLRLQTMSAEPRGRVFLLFLLVETAFLLGYLSLERVQNFFGRAYLPLALIYASASPIVEQSLAVLLRQADLLGGGEGAGGLWWLMILLLVPVILVSWQYRMRVLLIFLAGVTTLELLLLIPIALSLQIEIRLILGVILVQTLLFMLIGSILVRLMKSQREQRAELARANQKLELQASTIEQLAISRERNRLARELHDTLAHTLSGLAIQLEAVYSIWESDSEKGKNLLNQSLNTTRTGLQDARRAIQALRSSVLEDLGLILALRNLAHAAEQRGGLAIHLQLPGAVENLDMQIEETIFRIAEQSIANVIQHAQATELSLSLHVAGSGCELRIVDNGIGIDSRQQDREGRFGLRGMRERAELVGGDLHLGANTTGGTMVHFIVGAG
jgi:signal transduction histidine kinase